MMMSYGDRSNNDCVLRGAAAGLGLLRAATTTAEPPPRDNNNNNNNDHHQFVRTTALAQFLTTNERVLYGPAAVQVHLVEPTSLKDDNDNNENDDIDNVSSSSSTGQIVITSERLLFWTTTTRSSTSRTVDDDEGDEGLDLVVPGLCIELHALTNEPEMTVYVQVQLETCDWPLELTIVPDTSTANHLGIPDNNNSSSSRHNVSCNALVQALSELISLHPIDPNDNDSDNTIGGMLPMMSMMMDSDMTGNEGDNQDCHNDNDDYGNGDDDMVYYTAASPSLPQLVATEEERQAMLDRLDNLLIVPPELEQEEDSHERNNHVEGQFDDAEDDDDDDENDDELL